MTKAPAPRPRRRCKEGSNSRALFAALLLAVPAAGCAAGSFATAFAEPAREGAPAPVDVLEVRWRRALTEPPMLEYKPQEFAAATSDGTRVFVGSSAKVFWALRAADGAPLWKHTFSGAISSRPLYVGELELVLVGDDDGVMHAFDAQSGAERWTYHAKGPVASQPVYADELVYFASGENRVYALDAHRGTWKWQYDRESPDSFTIRSYPSPLVVRGRVYAGFSDGYLACLQAASGDVLWARSLSGEATRFMDVDSTPFYYRGTIYVSSYASGVYALDPKDGSTRWKFDVEGAGSVRATGARVYFAAAKAGVHALDLDGHLLWRQALAAGGELSTPTLVNGLVLVSSSRGGTYIADAANGYLYQFFSPGHGVTSEATTDGHQVYVVSNTGQLFAFAFHGGRR